MGDVKRVRVLVTGTEGAGIDECEHRLRAEGFEVLVCPPVAVPGPQCLDLVRHEQCPAIEGVDVIVAARNHPLPHLTASEKLTRCALLNPVPLVVAGSTVVNPFGDRADVLVEGYERVGEACREALARRQGARAGGPPRDPGGILERATARSRGSATDRAESWPDHRRPSRERPRTTIGTEARGLSRGR